MLSNFILACKQELITICNQYSAVRYIFILPVDFCNVKQHKYQNIMQEIFRVCQINTLGYNHNTIENPDINSEKTMNFLADHEQKRT